MSSIGFHDIIQQLKYETNEDNLDSLARKLTVFLEKSHSSYEDKLARLILSGEISEYNVENIVSTFKHMYYTIRGSELLDVVFGLIRHKNLSLTFSALVYCLETYPEKFDYILKLSYDPRSLNRSIIKPTIWHLLFHQVKFAPRELPNKLKGKRLK